MNYSEIVLSAVVTLTSKVIKFVLNLGPFRAAFLKKILVIPQSIAKVTC